MPPPRRAPAPAERQRDAERTKAALLDAARTEFAAKGLAGARVSAIADRAGVNKQLISYYFGGKDGLYDAILQAWHAQEREIADPEASLADLVAGYLRVGHEQADLQRLFIRQSLDDERGQEPGDPGDPGEGDLEAMRARQRAGQFADELDPGFLQVFLQGMVTATALFPGDARRLTGLEPGSEAYLAKAEEQLRLVVERLALERPVRRAGRGRTGRAR